MNNQNNNQQPWTVIPEEDDKLHVEYQSKIAYLDIEQLCRKTNSLLRSMFQDFQGSFLQVVQNQNGNGFTIVPILYFAEPTPSANKDLPRAFKPIVQEQSNNIGMRAMNISKNLTRKSVYEMTEEGIGIFTANFIYSDGGVKYNPQQFTTEEEMSQQFGNNTTRNVRVKTFGIDMRLLIGMIIKGITPNDVVFFTPVATVGSSNPQAANFTNTLLKMEVVGMDEFEKIGRKYHIGEIQNISTNAGPIVTI